MLALAPLESQREGERGGEVVGIGARELFVWVGHQATIGMVPHSIAMEIARAREGEVQQALAQAYEERKIPGNQVLAIRQIIEQRNNSGKQLHARGRRAARTRTVTSESLIRAYQREMERQKLLVKRASLARSRLLFVANAMRRLLADEHFVALLRAEGLSTLPRPLAERVGPEAFP
jgi:ParB family transcriptional regulator, chromosome partitioning protein